MQKIFAAALFAASAMAQEESPESRKFSHIVKMVHNQIEAAGSSWDSKTVSKRFQNYGCHCFPNNLRIAGGAGPAQDGIDSLCKKLARCHKCIAADYGISSFTAEWDADIGKYRWAAVNGGISCENNDDQYKKDLCECDAAFAEAVGAQWNDADYDNSLWGNRKNSEYALDYDNVCVGTPGADSSECCGIYPNRFPFQTATHMCCSDNSIATIGSC